MPKSCMKKRKSAHRVTFNKVVGVNMGSSKKLKRVNATKLAYDILRSPLDAASVRGLVEKHKQYGSTREAIQESIRTLHRLDMRVCKNGTIGAFKITTLRGALTCSNKLSEAKTVLGSGVTTNF